MSGPLTPHEIITGMKEKKKVEEELMSEVRKFKLETLSIEVVKSARRMMLMFTNSINLERRSDGNDKKDNDKRAFGILRMMLREKEGCCPIQNLLVNVVTQTHSLLEKETSLRNELLKSKIRDMLDCSKKLLSALLNEIKENTKIPTEKGLEELENRKIVAKDVGKSIQACLKKCPESKKRPPQSFCLKSFMAKTGPIAAPAAKKRKEEPKPREKISQNVVKTQSSKWQGRLAREALMKERQLNDRLRPWHALVMDLIKNDDVFYPDFRELSREYGLDRYSMALAKEEENPAQYVPQQIRDLYSI